VSADRACGNAEGLLPTGSGVADLVVAARRALAWFDTVEPQGADEDEIEAALEAANDWLNDIGWEEAIEVRDELREALAHFSAPFAPPHETEPPARKEPR